MIYTLEKYKTMKSRYTCPACGKLKVFSRYINLETNEHLSPLVGRCNRESKCGYHYKPKQYFIDNPSEKTTTWTRQIKQPIRKPKSFIPKKVLNESRNSLKCNLMCFMCDHLGEEITNRLIELYQMGKSAHWKGATVFWQIDRLDRIRTGKIMLYDTHTGKRIKEPYHHITWVHSVLKLNDYNLEQCFFGEHLLKDNTKPVSIVESEKTALVCSAYYPDFIWLAAGSLNNLNEKKCKILAGRNVTLFPDKGCFDKWKERANELSSITLFKVSNYLEDIDSINQGDDLADYLLIQNQTA